MISIYANQNKKAYGTKIFMIESEDDVKNLPINCTPGSLAKMTDGTSYMLGNNKKWSKIPSSGSGSGSGEGGSIVYVDAEALTREELLNILN